MTRSADSMEDHQNSPYGHRVLYLGQTENQRAQIFTHHPHLLILGQSTQPRDEAFVQPQLSLALARGERAVSFSAHADRVAQLKWAEQAGKTIAVACLSGQVHLAQPYMDLFPQLRLYVIDPLCPSYPHRQDAALRQSISKILTEADEASQSEWQEALAKCKSWEGFYSSVTLRSRRAGDWFLPNLSFRGTLLPDHLTRISRWTDADLVEVLFDERQPVPTAALLLDNYLSSRAATNDASKACLSLDLPVSGLRPEPEAFAASEGLQVVMWADNLLQLQTLLGQERLSNLLQFVGQLNMLQSEQHDPLEAPLRSDHEQTELE